MSTCGIAIANPSNPTGARAWTEHVTNVTRATSTLTKTAGADNAFNAQAYAAEGAVIGLSISFKPGQTNKKLVVGLDAAPAGHLAYSDLDYGWWCEDTGILYIFEGGTEIGSFGSYTAATVLSITYDGTHVRYYAGGVLQRTVARATGMPLYFDALFYGLNGAITDVVYGITGIDIARLSLRIVESANSRNTATLVIHSPDGTCQPERHAELLVTEDATRIFGALVTDTREVGRGLLATPIVLTVQASDFNSYADRRVVTETLSPRSLQAVLQALEPYLTAYGVTLDASQVTGPTLPELVWYRLVLARALDQLTDLTGYTWEIDYTRTLRMTLPSSTAAPFTVQDGDLHVEGDIAVERPGGTYANKIRLRYTEPATSAYGYFVLTTGNFADGDTVTLGAQTYTFRTTPSETYDIPIGASGDDSVQSLGAAIDAVGLCVTQWGTAWWGTVHGLKVVAVNAGSAGNGITVGRSNPDCVFRNEGSSSDIAALEYGTDAGLTGEAIAQDAGEIAAVDLWERLVDRPEITSATVAAPTAATELAKAIADVPIVRYSTPEAGIHPGQVQVISVAARHVDGDFIITDVTIANTKGNLLRRAVTAALGTAIPHRWQDDAKTVFSVAAAGA